MTFHILSVVIVSCFTGLFCQNVVDVAVSLGLNKLAQAINDTGLYEEWATDGNNLIFKSWKVLASLTFRFNMQSFV